MHHGQALMSLRAGICHKKKGIVPAMLCTLVGKVSVVLLSMEERSALFATSISSRVDDTADDNLERSNWLASIPVLSTYTQHFNTFWLPTIEFKFKRQI
jgi:hypothetical protein